MSATNSPNQLIDRFGRSVSYIRLSVTDRCDLRCVYCMPEKMKFVPRTQLLTLEEMESVAHAFIKLGVDKIRITGGEPLVRRNIMQLFNNLGDIEALRDLTLTAGVTRINVSLDTLRAERFRDMTRIGDLQKTLDGIDAAIACDFQQIKLNAVVLKNHNHDEILDLVNYCIDRGIDISFIEEMPLGQNDHHDRAASYYSSDQILDDLAPHFEMVPTTMKTAGPTRYYQLTEHENTRTAVAMPGTGTFDGFTSCRSRQPGSTGSARAGNHRLDANQAERPRFQPQIPGSPAAPYEPHRRLICPAPRKQVLPADYPN
jgi:cyclic pyranopterin phosphate synthase